MKKKFLSFVLAICLILPCAFALSACGKNPEPSGPVDLAGKTIVVQAGSCELDWDYNIPITSIEQGDNGAYATELTLEQFVEHFIHLIVNLLKLLHIILTSIQLKKLKPQ